MGRIRHLTPASCHDIGGGGGGSTQDRGGVHDRGGKG